MADTAEVEAVAPDESLPALQVDPAPLTSEVEDRVSRHFGESYTPDWCGSVSLGIAAELHACGGSGRRFAEELPAGPGREALLSALHEFDRQVR